METSSDASRLTLAGNAVLIRIKPARVGGARIEPRAEPDRAGARTSKECGVRSGYSEAIADEHCLEARHIDDPHVLLLDLDQAVLLELGEQPAHGLQLQPEIPADLLAGHAEVKLGRRVTAPMETAREIEKEHCEPLLGTHRAEEHHHAVVAHDLARQHAMELPLERRNLACERLDQTERQHAHLAVLERDRVAVIGPRGDAVQTEELAWHVEAGHLLAAVILDRRALEETAADGVDRAELVARAE